MEAAVEGGGVVGLGEGDVLGGYFVQPEGGDGFGLLNAEGGELGFGVSMVQANSSYHIFLFVPFMRKG